MLNETDREVFNDILPAMIQAGNFIKDFKYKGYTLNPDEEHVNVILEGLKNRDGYCPCRVQRTPENKCVCDAFIRTGECCCKLWVKAEDKE